MASSLALAFGLYGATTAAAQAPAAPPENPLANQPPIIGDYRLMRGQTIQLKKPANSSAVVEPAPAAPPAVPVDPAINLPARYLTQDPPTIPQGGLGADPKAPQGAKLQSQDPVKDPQAKPATDPATAQGPTGSGSNYKPKTTLPSTEELYRLDSAKTLQTRIQRETGQSEGFPAQPDFSYDHVPSFFKIPLVYEPRNYAKASIVVEANFVCYERLLFEDKNAERYGWDLGYIQEAVSVGYFVKDVLFMPYHAMSHPFCQECTPKCLPGDQVPYKYYRDDLTVTGLVGETAFAAALVFLFP